MITRMALMIILLLTLTTGMWGHEYMDFAVSCYPANADEFCAVVMAWECPAGLCSPKYPEMACFGFTGKDCNYSFPKNSRTGGLMMWSQRGRHGIEVVPKVSQSELPSERKLWADGKHPACPTSPHCHDTNPPACCFGQ